ncbi:MULTISPECIES: glycosyltransferase family 10 domain-containing protein [Megamonas]|uniref:Uncharacterized protein n=1 Tax=Megamonas rupellensis TaxID=491921 RepID=A0A412CC02_9FIRM|nr:MULTISPECIES: glycosyltransferase family 10 [Megamonas]MCX4131381.1 glycosyltransferase family 10 [Megamonas funiformis]RGQ78369.1 hypothetical protein DWY77_10710 [Megamonas rupellensis]
MMKNKLHSFYMNRMLDLSYIKDLIRKKNIIFDSEYDNISYVNTAKTTRWFTQFIKYNFDVDEKYIRFYGVFGPSRHLKEKNVGVKIFFSGENLETPIRHKLLIEHDTGVKSFLKKTLKYYKGYPLENMDLSIGFSNLSNEKYVRFPYWIIRLFEPNITYAGIKEKIYTINNLKRYSFINKAVVINRHDDFGLRTKICDDLDKTLEIVYAGKWRNNTNDLWRNFNNDKIKYMKQFMFNICPENIDAPYYVTEKLFEAFLAGNIPIYSGCLNNPEPNIINNKSLILWNLDDKNDDKIKIIRKLMRDETLYYKFIRQEKMKKESIDIIYDYIENLRYKLKIILK